MWAKVYVVGVKVDVVWADEVFAESLAISTVQHFAMRLVLPRHHRSKEVLSMGYIQDLLFPYF